METVPVRARYDHVSAKSRVVSSEAVIIRGIPKARMSEPAGYRNVLLAVERVSHWRSSPCLVGLEAPKRFSSLERLLPSVHRSPRQK